MNLEGLKYLVVGAGFWGAVLAERIASQLDEKVLVVDARDRIGGTSASCADPETGIECHLHGTHIFHTRLPKVWEYVTRFADFTQYRHKVFTTCGDRVYCMPIGLSTINAWYGSNLKPWQVPEFLAGEIAKSGLAGEPRNLEEKAISLIGRPLYEAFIRGYTWKQWNMDPAKLPASIITRLPVRSNYDTDYFADPWEMQGLPREGYNALFEKILSHPNIDRMLNTDFFDLRATVPEDCTVLYSGPIDRLFDYRFGRLEWRSLRFEWSVEPVSDRQGTSVMNYADRDVLWTRIHEFRHLHPERDYPADKTVLCTEFPKTYASGDEPYYSVNVARNDDLYARYKAEGDRLPRIHIGGRLGSYRYYDMDRTIDEALNLFETKLAR